MTDARFYTVANARFFPGTVALLNSLRLTGHAHELVVLDAGLRPELRARLEAQTTVVDLSHDSTNPLLLKPYPYVVGATGTVVVIDSDIIVTSSLGGLIEAASHGVCVLSDDQPHPHYTTDPHRWFPEWRELLDLEAPLRRGTYVNTGVIALSTYEFPELLRRWWEAAQRVPFEATATEGARHDSPLCDSDQDVFNALLMSEVPDGVVTVGAQEASDALAHVEIRDAGRLECVHRGRRALVCTTRGRRSRGSPARAAARPTGRIRPACSRASCSAGTSFCASRPTTSRRGYAATRALVPTSSPPSPSTASPRALVRRTSGRLRRRLTDLRDRLTAPR